MTERREIRVSDHDRQLAADRLKSALNDGRLNLFEYDERLSQAYASATFADLDPLLQDLPTSVGAPAATPAPARKRPTRPAATGLPTPLRVLWIVYASVLAINLVTWVLVSLGNGTADYFWPMWLLVPGTILLVVTLGVQSGRRGRATG